MSVFKYMPTHIYNKDNEKIDILKYIFEDNVLWFSNPLNFNDPFELKPNIKKLVNEENHLVVDMVSSYFNDSNQAHEVHYAYINPILNNTGILSLSGNKEHLAMWAHYANNHKGIVVEFAKNHSFFSSLQLPNYAVILHYLEKVVYIPKNNRKSINSNEYFTKDTFLIKSQDWEYEDEYRMSVYIETNDEYIDGINIIFPSDLINCIYIGNKAEKETITYIMSLQKTEQWKHLKIYQMQLDTVSYKLIPKELT
jgi:hypothetical protein